MFAPPIRNPTQGTGVYNNYLYIFLHVFFHLNVVKLSVGYELFLTDFGKTLEPSVHPQLKVLPFILFPQQTFFSFLLLDSTDPALQSHLQQPVEKNGYQVLPRGDYSFTFYMVIPSDQNLPPSLEEKFGHIRYWFRGVIKRGRGRTDIKTSDATWKIGDVSLEDFEEEMVGLNT